jgi:hypothetical protein
MVDRVKRRRRKRKRPTEAQMIVNEAKKLRKMMQTSDSTRARRLERLGLTTQNSPASDAERSPRRILGVRFG